MGNGVADDKLVYTYVPAMIRYYLGEDPILQNVETMHLVDNAVRKDALSRRGELVFKRVDGSGGKGLVIGPAATGAELDELALEVEADPRHWIAQRVVALSTSPTWVDNTMVRRHVDLRPFAVNDGEDIWVLPGGLTRVALGEGGLVVNSSQGGGSKDTWVVGGGISMPVLPPRQVAPFQAGPPMDVGPASDGELGVQQQQQQQGQQQQQQRCPHAVTRALLSRVAESIFWVGRYVERAEGTARILDVSVYQALEQSDVEGSLAARRLLAVMGLPDSGTETLWQATERLATDPESRSSIAGALAAARENTRAVRHVVPVEFWEHINATWAELPLRWETGRRAGPAFYLSFVKTQCAGMMGLADTMMSRDQTWLFFTLGRCLERTDVVARQLATVAFDEVFDSGLVMLLRSCGGYEPYLRLSQGVVEPGRVLDFLLRDRLFPRSAFASLTLAEECLDQINAGREGAWDDARGLVGLARAELEYSAPATLSRGSGDPAGAPAGLHLLGERRRDAALLRPGPPDAVAAGGWGRVSRTDGWRLRVSHETRFDYDAPARASYNELRLTPRTELRQTALETRVVTLPPAPQYSYLDYWGTHVVAFNVDRGHEVLVDHGELAGRHAAFRRPRGLHVGGRRRRHHDDGRPPVAQPLHGARARAVRDRAGTARRSPARNGATHHGHHTRVVALRARRHLGAHLGRRGLHRRCGRLSGLRALGLGLHQVGRVALALRLGLLPPGRRRRHRRGDHGGEPRLGGGVDGTLVGLRPDERLPGGGAPRRRRARARLRRRATGQGHLRRQRREHHAGGGAHGEGPLSVANPD